MDESAEQLKGLSLAPRGLPKLFEDVESVKEMIAVKPTFPFKLANSIKDRFFLIRNNCIWLFPHDGKELFE
jgi:hypothetical protein